MAKNSTGVTTANDSYWIMTVDNVYSSSLFLSKVPLRKNGNGHRDQFVPGFQRSNWSASFLVFFSSKGRYDWIWEKYKSWVNLRPTYVVTWMTKGAFREKKWQKRRGNTTICVKLLDPYYTMCRKSHLRESFELYSLSFFLLRHVDFDRLTQSSILYWWNRWLIVIGTIRSKSCAAAVNVAHALK